MQLNCIININRNSNFKRKSVILRTKKNLLIWDDNTLYKLNKKKQSFHIILKSKKTPLEIECKEFIKSISGKKFIYDNAIKAFKVLQILSKFSNR